MVDMRNSRSGMGGKERVWEDSFHELRRMQAQVRHQGLHREVRREGTQTLQKVMTFVRFFFFFSYFALGF